MGYPPPPPPLSHPRPPGNVTALDSSQLTTKDWIVMCAVVVVVLALIVGAGMFVYPPTYWHEMCYVDGRKVFDEILLHDGDWTLVRTGERVKTTFDNCVRVEIDPPYGLTGR